jgi:hypothetical protein
MRLPTEIATIRVPRDFGHAATRGGQPSLSVPNQNAPKTRKSAANGVSLGRITSVHEQDQKKIPEHKAKTRNR